MKTDVYNWWEVHLAFVQTGILAATAYWAWRYTQETVALRRAAQEQAQATARQLELAAEQAKATNRQLEIAQASFDDLKTERKRASRPFFLITGISGGGGSSISFSVANKGATVYGVQTDAQSPVSNINFVLPGYFEAETSGNIGFASSEGSLPEKWWFTIRYFTLLNEPHTQSYIVEGRRVRSAEPGEI